MKKIFFTLTAFLAMAMLFASCEKNAGPDNPAAITIEFSLDDDSETTKSSSTAQLSLNNGCTVAFYSKSSGNLLATGACEGNTRKIVITSVPTENCNVYAVGNATFDWPSKQSSLAGKEMSIDVTKNYIPRSTRTGTNAYSWNVGTTYLEITDMPKMYSKISVYRNQPSGTDFTATSAKVLNCPNVIYPFGNTSTGTAGTKDVATSADITLFNNGNHFTLWVPSEGTTKVELKGTRTNGSGINYTDTYTITVPAISREDSKNTEVIVNGENSGEQIVVVIGDDTRNVSFGTSTLNVIGDGTNYSTYVKGVAGNGETGWTYNLSWTGVSELAGNTTISVNGQPAVSLGTSGSISLPGDGNNKNIVINSTYSGSTQKTVILNATNSNGTSSNLQVNVSRNLIFYCNYSHDWTYTDYQDWVYENYVVETIYFTAKDGNGTTYSSQVNVNNGGFHPTYASTTYGDSHVAPPASCPVTYLSLYNWIKNQNVVLKINGTDMPIDWSKTVLVKEGDIGSLSMNPTTMNMFGDGNSRSLIINSSVESYTVSASGLNAANAQISKDGTNWTTGAITCTSSTTLYIKSTYSGSTPKTVTITASNIDNSVNASCAVTISSLPRYTVTGHYSYQEYYNEYQDGTEYLESTVENYYLTVTDGVNTWNKPQFTVWHNNVQFKITPSETWPKTEWSYEGYPTADEIGAALRDPSCIIKVIINGETIEVPEINTRNN